MAGSRAPTDAAEGRRDGGIVPDLSVGLAVASTYFAAAWLGLKLAVVGESVTPLWPPTGLALVAFLLFGYRVWPAVTVAAFLVNLPISGGRVALEIAAGNTLAPIAAAALLRATRFRLELDRTRDALLLVLLGALGAMTISATVGTLALDASGTLSEPFWSTWAVWWAGDAMGILAVAPFLLWLRSVRLRRVASWARAVEVALLAVLLVATALLLTTTPRPVWVAVFPLLVWVAWRFEQRGAGPAALLVIVIASWAASRRTGPFTDADLLQRMVALQVFNAAVAVTSFFFAAVVAERAAARRDLERSARALYQREQRIAEALQRSLLPGELPSLPDVATVARYIPASTDAEVGGDWYDVMLLPEGGLGIAIGDVAGQGLSAAATMGQMRMALRAYGLEGRAPADVLARLDEVVRELQPGVMATIVYAQLDLDTGVLTIANAGHPPPAILEPGGRTRFATGGLSPPLGIGAGTAFAESIETLTAGSTLVLYTDGLVERRGAPIDDGLRRLARALSDAPDDIEALGDHVVASLVGERATDDTALLAVRRIGLAGRPLVLSIGADPARLGAMRRILARWLRENDTGDEDALDILAAVSEACANAVQHAYGAREGRVEVRGTIEEGAVRIRIRDHGTWRARASADGGGRGLVIMRGLMDEVSIDKGPSGTEVVLTRRARTRAGHG